MRFFYALSNRAGVYEFAWRYPHIFNELKARHEFEHRVAGISSADMARYAYEDLSVYPDNYVVCGGRGSTSDAAAGGDNAATMASDDIAQTVIATICRGRSGRSAHKVTIRDLRECQIQLP